MFASLLKSSMDEPPGGGPSCLEQILSGIGYGVAVIDDQFRVLFTNAAMRQLSGLESIFEEALCHRAFEKRDEICPGCPAVQVFKTQEVTHVVRQYTRKDGSGRSIKVSAYPLPEKGRTTRCLLAVRDVTEVWNADRQREDLLRMLMHDIRNPVLSVAQSLDNLTRGAYGNLKMEQTRILSATLDSCDLLLAMIDDLLDVYQHQAGLFRLSLSQFDLVEAIRKTVGLLHSLAGEVEIVLKDHTEPKLPLFRGDRLRLARVMINLLENAIKFSPPGKKIEIRVVRHHDSVLVSVTDEGPGILPEYQERVFEKYFQLEYASPGCKPGMGIGLAFCKQAVEAHGGKIWVESPIRGIDRGSRFLFTLPLED